MDLVNQEPKEAPIPSDVKTKIVKALKEMFHYPTPADLSAKDLAPNKPP